MSAAPRVPGMEAYPELEKKYKRKYRQAQSSGGGCNGCEISRVLLWARAAVEARQARDKMS